MKKVFFLFIIIFIMTNKVFSLEFNPTNKIISIPEIDGFYLQGFTTVDDKIFAVIIADDESKCIFKVFDINDNKEIFSKTEKSVGHANDVTFNNKDNRIYIVHGGGTDIVHVYDTNYNYRVSSGLRSMPCGSPTAPRACSRLTAAGAVAGASSLS